MTRRIKTCPTCGQPCVGVFRKPVRSRYGKVYYYYYASHYDPEKAKRLGVRKANRWCYIGKSLPKARGR
jgi:hypothetical protein